MALGQQGYQNRGKRVIRSFINPLDKATIVSIFPREIHETRATIQPSEFHIAKGTFEKPSILVIGSCSWWREMEEGQPDLEITCSSVEVANSIVNDYSNGLLRVTLPEVMPGLFFVPGELTVDEIKKNHKDRLEIARVKQTNWFRELIEEADKLWARSQGNPLVIWDVMKIAAESLQLKDKPWMKDHIAFQMINCPYCGNLRNSNYPICSHCNRVVDADALKKIELAKAGN